MSASLFTEKANNVIMFPKKGSALPLTAEELRQKITINRMEMADILAEEIAKENLRIMDDNGYQSTNTKDVAFLVVTLKSILLRCDDIFYPLQKIIDENVALIDDDDPEGTPN